MNITTLSLLDIGECEVGNTNPKQEEVYIQLMQTSDYDQIPITQCKVEMDRMVSYCGMHSHISMVHNGRREFTIEVGEDACKKIHDTGVMVLASAVLDNLKRNSTNYRSATIAGTLSMDGKCSGTQYSDAYGSWDSVVVQASIKVTLRTFEAPLKRSTGQVMLPSGTHCLLSTKGCLDSEGAESYWPVPLMDTCHFDQYDVLYEGLAARLTSPVNPQAPIVYTVTTQETTFALTKTHETSVCGYKLMQTEHPKLFILETTRGKTFKARAKMVVENLDIFSYVNSKFVYVEKHVRTQLTRLYQDIMEQKCALERQVIQNALSLASIAPDEMAYRLMKGPGYTAITTGEVIHIIKCIPVDCRIRPTEECYDELPVTHRNHSFFLLPRSRILTSKGTAKDCNGLLPNLYRIDGTWYRMTPRPIEALSPPVIEPLTQPKWQYTSSSSLATSGIYSAEDLDRLRTHIMFPVEKPSMLNNIAQGAMGGKVKPGTISMINLLDEASLERIAESTGARMWKGFVSFGSASAGVFAIFLIARVIKLCIDTIIHGYALHTVYGWSLHLLGAIWTSVTNLLLHTGSRRNQKTRGADTEMEEGRPLSPPEAQLPGPSCPKEDKVAPVLCEQSAGINKYNYRTLRQYLKDSETNTP